MNYSGDAEGVSFVPRLLPGRGVIRHLASEANNRISSRLEHPGDLRRSFCPSEC